MRTTLLRLFAAAAMLALVAAPASACINDFETERQERQFKSLYPDTPGPSPGNESVSPLVSYAGAGAGIALLAAAGYLGLIRRPW